MKMTLANAIKKLTKAGFEISEGYNRGFKATFGRQVVEFFLNGGREDEITCIRVRYENDNDDSITDYCAGVFADNISQAIRIATA